MKHPSLPGQEEAILGELLAIRDKLCLLRQDRSTYLKSHDVLSQYYKVMEQLHSLTDLRGDRELEQNDGQ